MKKSLQLIPAEVIENKIYIIRGQKVMLDSDLARLYQVETKGLVQAVKRNRARFPNDFMFQVSQKEAELMRSQIVTASKRNTRYTPYVFTEHGVTMLASILKSKRAVETSILIVRAFIKLREMLQSHKDVLQEIEKIKRDQRKHGEKISAIMQVINKLLAPDPVSKKEQIGFKAK